jgi:hypothetical protein
VSAADSESCAAWRRLFDRARRPSAFSPTSCKQTCSDRMIGFLRYNPTASQDTPSTSGARASSAGGKVGHSNL